MRKTFIAFTAALLASPAFSDTLIDHANGIQVGAYRLGMVLAEHANDAETWKKPMESALAEAGADKDDAIVEQAQGLLKLLAGKQGGQQVYGSGAAADRGGIAAGQGGIAAGGNVTVGNWGRDER